MNSTQPAHSRKDIRDSGNSKGDGEYWIDPDKSGNPLKVFCDMTTDGGKSRRMLKNVTQCFIVLKLSEQANDEVFGSLRKTVSKI